jgi:hypothetical protein
VGELADLLFEYESDRKRYPTFDAFVPRVAEFFDGYVGRYEKLLARRPKVLSMTPANGASGVDPGLAEIKIVFDRPMRDGSWSMCGGGPHYPEFGELHYDADCKVLTAEVRLKPNWSYEFWLNHPPYMSFQSAEGLSLDTVHVTFQTGS